jgi:formylmethanofuran dehydrogenase subunit C
MSDTITLTLKSVPEYRVVADAIAPDRFAAMSAAEIARVPLWVARRGPEPRSAQGDPHIVALGDVFSVHGERASAVRVVGNAGVIDGLGTGMSGGSLTIEGDAGREVGRGMTGGTLSVHGDAGDGAGLAMAGGSLWIAGRAGSGVGSALPGASRGMTGGEIFVRRGVGRDAGAGVRRGLIVIGGDADDGAARAMIAGTLVVMGRIAGTVGLWNKRGTVLALGGAAVPATYRLACTYRPPHVRLLLTYIRRAHGVPVEDRFVTGRYTRYCGDLSELGKGEILTWTE